MEMTQSKIQRCHVIQNSLEGKITVAEAAEILGLSERQVVRLRNGVKREGAPFMTHKNKGKAPVNALSNENKAEMIRLHASGAYCGANFQHFTGLLTNI